MPIRHAETGAEDARTTQRIPMPSLLSGPERRTVVYVEDNPSNIAFMRELLEELSSIELMTAPTAEIGLELIRSHRPKIVIMDINVPGMSGLEAVKRLREWPETATFR